jgi:hypothetical protein
METGKVVAQLCRKTGRVLQETGQKPKLLLMEEALFLQQSLAKIAGEEYKMGGQSSR